MILKLRKTNSFFFLGGFGPWSRVPLVFRSLQLKGCEFLAMPFKQVGFLGMLVFGCQYGWICIW